MKKLKTHSGHFSRNSKSYHLQNDDVMSTKSTNKKSAQQEAFDNWLDACINTPPITNKDLKKRKEKRKRTK